MLESNTIFKHVIEGKNSKLAMEKALPEWSGTYKCIAENEVGTSETKATIKVHGK